MKAEWRVCSSRSASTLRVPPTGLYTKLSYVSVCVCVRVCVCVMMTTEHYRHTLKWNLKTALFFSNNLPLTNRLYKYDFIRVQYGDGVLWFVWVMISDSCFLWPLYSKSSHVSLRASEQTTLGGFFAQNTNRRAVVRRTGVPLPKFHIIQQINTHISATLRSISAMQ